MLLVKLQLRDYPLQSTETKVDLFNAIKMGYREGSLSSLQIKCIIYWIKGYSITTIAAALLLTDEECKELLCASFRYIEQKTHYFDYSVIRYAKGDVKPEHIAKCNYVAENAWED